jgi:hypothetical protein
MFLCHPHLLCLSLHAQASGDGCPVGHGPMAVALQEEQLAPDEGCALIAEKGRKTRCGPRALGPSSGYCPFAT